MQKDIFDKIISFLLGASWAFVVFGAILTFQLLIQFGVGMSLFFTIVFIVISLFMIVLLDALVVNKQKLYEIKKQTLLLEKLLQEKE